MEIDKRKLIMGIGAGFPLFLFETARAQNVDLNSILGVITKTQTQSTGGLPLGVSQADANSGMKEALINGAAAAVLRLGKFDGYWQDGKVRIPLPKPFNQIQKNLQPLGLSSKFDDLQLKINRAAEVAAPKAKTIFVNTIKSVTLEDITGIIRGGDTAGTEFLKAKTKPALMTEFRPPMLTAVNSSGAAKSLANVNAKYGSQIQMLGGLTNLRGQNNVETTKGAKSDLTSQFVDFACSKALDGLFYYIGQEEAAIRQDPMKQTSSLLKKVFGGL